MDKWQGKVALVTGSSKGIGKNVAENLVKHGLIVIGCGRKMEDLVKLKNELPEEMREKFIPFQCDIRKEEEILSMFSFIRNNFKELSILINNAGVVLEGSILHGNTENFKNIYETNVLGLCMCSREAFSLMHEKELGQKELNIIPGHIININSTAGHKVFSFSSIHFYSASKFSVTAITEGIRQELNEIKSNIKVTQISPGPVETGIFSKAREASVEQKIKVNSLQKLETQDVTSAVIFVLSTEARNNVNEIIIAPTGSA